MARLTVPDVMTWVMEERFTRRNAEQTSCVGGLGWKGKDRANSMASAKRIIRKTLLEIMQSEKATISERIKAARLLTKLSTSAETGNSRRGHTGKK